MAGKPRVTVRLEASIVAVLEWYAGARAIPPAELAAELIGAGVLEALVDADLRALVTEHAGPPPSVPIAALATKRFPAPADLQVALSELRAVGDELALVEPRMSERLALAAQRVEGHAVLIRDAFVASQRRHAQAADYNGAARPGAAASMSESVERAADLRAIYHRMAAE